MSNAMELAEEDWDTLKAAFSLINREGDDAVQARDLANFVRDLCGRTPTDREMEDLVNQVDSNGNGTIDFPSFAFFLVSRLSSTPDDHELRLAFRLYDRDNTGYIGQDQIRAIMVKVQLHPTDDELEAYINDADEDKDGVLNFEEFANMMTPS